MHTTHQQQAPDTPTLSPVAQLLRAVEHTLDQQADDSLPVDVDRLLGDHARALHGKHCAAVHGDVLDTVALLGAPPQMTAADLLRDVRAALRLLGGA